MYTLSALKFWVGQVTILFAVLNMLVAAPTTPTSTVAPSRKVETETDALNYLTRFGYTSDAKGVSSQINEEQFKKYIKQFQYNAGIKQTGELDEETLQLMNTPRCQVKDNVGEGLPKRRRRYVIEGSRWPTTALTYSYKGYSKRLGSAATQRILEKSFKDWSDVSAVTFRETPSSLTRNHIEVLFASKAHGDSVDFDGAGGVFGHAFFPFVWGSLGGDAHFDDDELWVEFDNGTNLRQVATHEIGHSLGLSHSNERQAVMYAYYRGYNENFRLHADDINGIQYIYGPRTSPVTNMVLSTSKASSPAPTSPPLNVPDICNNAKINAMVVVGETTYAFFGEYYYELNGYELFNGSPKKILSKWPGLTSVDAALYFESRYSGETAHLFLFKGSFYWRYSNVNSLDVGYPKAISVGFPGIPDYLDSALIWSGNGQTYFFKGAEYYRYTRGVGTDAGYPRPLSVWGGLPNSIDAAVQWINNKTYFFKGNQYWRFNDANVEVDYAGGYPRDIGPWWFACSSSLKSREVAGEAADVYKPVESKASQIATQCHIFYFLYSSLVLLYYSLRSLK